MGRTWHPVSRAASKGGYKVVTTGFQFGPRNQENQHVKSTPDNPKPSADMQRTALPDWKLAYRVPEACAATGVKRSKLYELIKAGRLAIRKADGCTLILRSELERYLRSLPSVTCAAA